MQDLKDFPLFDGLNDEELQDLQDCGDTFTQPEGDPLFKKGESGERFYAILDGLIKITVPDPLSERNKTLALLVSGEVFGEMAILTNQNRSGKATPARDSRLFSIHEDDFLDLFQNYSQLGINLSRVLSSRLWDTDSEVQTVTFKTIPGRLASQLIRLGKEFGTEVNGDIRIDIDLTHQELADIVGTNRETITRHLNKFDEKNIIKYEDSNLIIQDWNRLEGWM